MLQSRMKIWSTFVRHIRIREEPKAWKGDGVKYESVTYYPRHPDEKDPPIVPTKLLMVHRVKPFKGNPYWDKNVMKQMGFAENNRDPVIVKNTPEMCRLLWKIKHLIRVTPIKLPEKLPDPNDLGGCYLHENGTFQVTPKISSGRLESTKNFLNNPKTFKRDEIMERLRLAWLQGQL